MPDMRIDGWRQTILILSQKIDLNHDLIQQQTVIEIHIKNKNNILYLFYCIKEMKICISNQNFVCSIVNNF